MLLKVGENVVKQLGSMWDGELLTVSSGSKLFAYGTIVVLGGLWVNLYNTEMTIESKPYSATIIKYVNRLDPNETPSNSASQLDLSRLTLRPYIHQLWITSIFKALHCGSKLTCLNVKQLWSWWDTWVNHHLICIQAVSYGTIVVKGGLMVIVSCSSILFAKVTIHSTCVHTWLKTISFSLFLPSLSLAIYLASYHSHWPAFTIV